MKQAGRSVPAGRWPRRLQLGEKLDALESRRVLHIGCCGWCRGVRYPFGGFGTKRKIKQLSEEKIKLLVCVNTVSGYKGAARVDEAVSFLQNGGTLAGVGLSLQ